MSKDMSNKTWVYHETEKARIVTVEEAEKLYKDGWADTPAAFKEDVPEEDDPTVEVEPPAEDEDFVPEDPIEDETPSEDVSSDSDASVGGVPEEAPESAPEAPEGGSEEGGAPKKQLSHMNMAELTAVAKAEGVAVLEGMNKAKIRNAIIAHRNNKG